MASAVALWLQYLQTLSSDATARMAYHDGDKDELIRLATSARTDNDATGFLAHALPLPTIHTASFAASVNLQLRSLWRIGRSEEHTSELQSLMRISYAVFCLKKKTTTTKRT